MDFNEARRQWASLESTLRQLVERDPEQEVQGMALPVLDAVISEVRGLLPDSGVVQAAREVISPESVEAGEPVRAADALVVAAALREALPRPAPRTIAGRLLRRSRF